MLLPDVFFKDPFMNDFFNFPSLPNYEKNANIFAKNFMKTDIKELDDKYELRIDLPGVTKDDITIEVQEDNILITAKKAGKKDEKDKDGAFIHKERYEGEMQRSFYIGEKIDKDSIKAKLENGVLFIEATKTTPTKLEKKTIQIEG